MHLIEVDDFDLQAAKAVSILCGSIDGVVLGHMAFVVPAENAL